MHMCLNDFLSVLCGRLTLVPFIACVVRVQLRLFGLSSPLSVRVLSVTRCASLEFVRVSSTPCSPLLLARREPRHLATAQLLLRIRLRSFLNEEPVTLVMVLVGGTDAMWFASRPVVCLSSLLRRVSLVLVCSAP